MSRDHIILKQKKRLVRTRNEAQNENGNNGTNRSTRVAWRPWGSLWTVNKETKEGSTHGGPLTNVESIGGVFAVVGTSSYGKEEGSGTIDTESTLSSNPIHVPAFWQSCNSPTHHVGSPLVARRVSSVRKLLRRHHHDQVSREADDAIVLEQFMKRAESLPRAWDLLCSNHVVVNTERVKRWVRPLFRSRQLDELARYHAQDMSDMEQLFHSDPEDTRSLFHVLQNQGYVRVGQNVARGPDLENIHRSMMDSVADRNNIIDRRFTLMGMGTSVDRNGNIYLCQFFFG